jgi:Fe-S cluster biogenesis protein NfuA
MQDAEVRARVAELESVLEDLDDRAAEAVASVVALYGEALRRIVAALRSAPGVADAVANDELVAHLLMLHDLHPETVEQRVRTALENLRPALGSHGGGVELLAIDGDVARVRLRGTCESCASSTVTLKRSVEEAVLRAAPEIASVEASEETVAAHAPSVFDPADDARRVVSLL